MRRKKLTQKQVDRFYRISACTGGILSAIEMARMNYVRQQYALDSIKKYTDEIFELNRENHMEIEYGTRTNT